MTGGTRAIRAGLWLLAATAVSVGWAVVAPRAFYDGFPLPGHAWVALLPPYNEHLVRDVGGMSLALALVLAAAALRPDRWTVRVAVSAALVFAVPHTAFHALHLEHFPTGDAVAQTAGTALQLALAVAVFVAGGRLPQRPARPRPAGSASRG